MRSLILLFLLALFACDARYMLRVVTRGDASSDDMHWKRSVWVEPSVAAAPWKVAPACDELARAFAAEGDIPPFAEYLAQGGAFAFVAVRDGTLACEWYSAGGEGPHAAFSVSKSVVALLLARAQAEGRISALDEPVTRYLPELSKRDPRFHSVTLAALLDMRSGIDFDENTRFPWVNRDAPRVYYASDLAQTSLTYPRIAAPPGAFRYNDYAPNLLGLALERAYASRLVPGPMRALWAALRAEARAGFLVDDRGFAWHESGLLIGARDLARIGQLMLDDGRVDGREVAPSSFIARSFDPAGASTAATFAGVALGYRNGWWIPGEGELLAMGRFGQIMHVSRAKRTVLVRLGRDGHEGEGLGFHAGRETNVSIAQRFRRVAARIGGP